MIKKILVANRGEISLRIIRTCKEMGIYTIAVFSEADRDSAHVALADEAICIGPPQCVKSYRDIFAVIDTAVISNVDAIHPGYGFLSENPQFVEICEKCNIIFIGPKSETLDIVSDRFGLRKKISKLGIPVIPWNTLE
jgi:acetyl-CoA carboxylase biotin carboxylase subunit